MFIKDKSQKPADRFRLELHSQIPHPAEAMPSVGIAKKLSLTDQSDAGERVKLMNEMMPPVGFFLNRRVAIIGENR